ncbi:MAG: Synechococcus phage [Bacteroidota bacterium]|jgi:hypothetical protein
MYIISNRGNLNGRISEFENQPQYVDEAIVNHGLFVKIDVWVVDNKFYLGNEEPTYLIDPHWLIYREADLLIQARNVDAVKFLNSLNLNWFWHETDELTISSGGTVLLFNDNLFIKDCITFVESENKKIVSESGVCADHPITYMKKYS